MKKLSKALAVCAVTAAAIILTGCKNAPEEKGLYEQGKELISVMNEMARSETYLNAFAYQEVSDKIAASVTSDYKDPEKVYEIRFGESFSLELLGMENFDGISETLKDNLISVSYSSFATQLNAAAGAEALTASSLCAASKSFINSEFEGNAVYLYMYGNSAPAAIAFSDNENGVVSASASFIFYDAFRPESKEDVEAFFEAFPAEVTEINIDG